MFRFRPWTAEGLAEQVTSEHFDKGLIYPPFCSIRKISANIAARVAAKAYDLGKIVFWCSLLLRGELITSTLAKQKTPSPYTFLYAGLASHLPRPRDLAKYAESCMYSHIYRSYRWSHGGCICSTLARDNVRLDLDCDLLGCFRCTGACLFISSQ